jgi:small subunit ribosomal protein S20
MANHASALKRVRRNQRRADINTARRSRIRTFLRKVEEAIASGDKALADAAYKNAQPELMRGAAKGLFHKNLAARKMARLSARIKAISA